MFNVLFAFDTGCRGGTLMPSSGLLAIAQLGAIFGAQIDDGAALGPPQKKHGDFSHGTP